MPLMTWTEDMSVNVPSIDVQHKKLVEMINELSEAMKVGKGKEALSSILDGLIAYTASHFKYEEDFFDKTHYPDAFNHKKEHTDLVKQVLDLQAKYKSGSVALSIDVVNFLTGWLKNHIMGTDKKYGAHLSANGIQ